MVLNLSVRTQAITANIQVDFTTTTLFKLNSTQAIEFQAEVDKAYAVIERMPDARSKQVNRLSQIRERVIKIAHFQN
jgi:hypothetical protein